jgi:hypothetical protein
MDGQHSLDGEALRERVAQLQHALDSRIVVEQAKGMLAERYGISTGEAFELIRLAARSNQLKVNAVSSEVIASSQTPPQILELLTDANLGNYVGADARARAIENVFREINQSLLKLDGDSGRFVCECADPECVETLDLSRASMVLLREDPNLYALKRGHAVAEIEQVVETLDSIEIVRKQPPQS